jgi:hypothetical protein
MWLIIRLTMTEREINKEIKRRYPMTEKERQGCRMEMARMAALRDMYRERLEQTGIYKRSNENKPEV